MAFWWTTDFERICFIGEWTLAKLISSLWTLMFEQFQVDASEAKSPSVSQWLDNLRTIRTKKWNQTRAEFKGQCLSSSAEKVKNFGSNLG